MVLNLLIYRFKDGKLAENSEIEIDKEKLDFLWKNHKLKSIDTPYGVCIQMINGNCELAQKPPCLTCNNGQPCENLLITEKDAFKYEQYIESQKEFIEKCKNHNRNQVAEQNKKLLDLYESIYKVIQDNGMIFGKKDRIKEITE